MESYCKILIVEDEFLLRQGIKNLVHWEQEGFQVVGETNNGKEALQLIDRNYSRTISGNQSDCPEQLQRF